MTYNELNEFILNYLENDITGRAIMLNGGWGSGKSYYIKNTLKPFLEEKKHKCAIVSLYGLTNVSEISKAIYLELRTIKKEPESEAVNTAKVVGKIVGKTLINGLVSKIGFEIGKISDEDIQEVYDSIDLSGKLIVLEDIERTQIDIVSLLGYINNMCENDGVKVLLVANEKELLQFRIETIQTTTNNAAHIFPTKKVYTDKSNAYLKAKEKTISDTLRFYADSQQVTNSIIDSFHNDDLSRFKDCIISSKVSNSNNGVINYREVIVACQKSCDIYNYMKKQDISTDDEFKKCVFIGLYNYLQKRITNPDLEFKEKTFSNVLSGNDFYPLMRFCFDYYHSQVLDREVIRTTISEYNEYLIYIDKSEYDDPDLRVLYDFPAHYEKDVLKAISSINDRLDSIKSIGINQYGLIIYYLLELKYDAGFDSEIISEIIEKIIRNLKGRGHKITDKHNVFSRAVEINNPNAENELNIIKSRVFEALDYTDDTLDKTIPIELINKLSSTQIRKYQPDKLIQKLQLDAIAPSVKDFSPLTLVGLHHVLSCIDYNELTDKSFQLLLNFKHEIEKNLKCNDVELDRLQKLRLNWIIKIIDKKTSKYFYNNQSSHKE